MKALGLIALAGAGWVHVLVPLLVIAVFVIVIGCCLVGIIAVACDRTPCGCAGCSDIDCGRGLTSGDVPVDGDASVSGFSCACARAERVGVCVCCVCSCDGVIVVGSRFGGCFSPCQS